MTHPTPRRLASTLLLAAAVLLTIAPAQAEDWPTYRQNNRRTGATAEQIDAAAMNAAWSYRSPVRPLPAWGRPARWDAYTGQGELNPLRNYDVAFQPVAVGGKVYFGSTVDDSLHCLDLATGEELWRFTAGGPIRIAPAVHEGRVYFGSDDGCAYCITADDGTLVWNYRPGARDMVIQDGRVISRWPVRSGVAVEDGTAYFAASLVPWRDSFLCAVDAATGEVTGEGRYCITTTSRTFEGTLASSSDYLVFPQGRTSPIIFQRGDGEQIGSIWANNGGTFVLITPEDRLISGGQIYRKHDGILDAPLNAPGDGAQIAITLNTWSMVMQGDRSYVLTRGGAYALNNSDKSQVWNIGGLPLYSLAVAGDKVLLGSDRLVRVVNAETGEVIVDLPAEGQVHGMIVTDGNLIVTTAEGAIHCYRVGEAGDTVAALPENQPLPPGAGDVKITMGPYLQFTADGEATVHWRTAEPSPTILYCETGEVRHDEPTTEHAATVDDLMHERMYHYVIGAKYGDAEEATSGAYEIDTTFNYNLPALRAGVEIAQAAEAAPAQSIAAQLLADANVDQGICVVLGGGNGTLAAELAQQSRLRVVVVESDTERIASIRQYLHEQNLNGYRVCVLPVAAGEPLPLPQSFANFVIDGDSLAGRESRFTEAEARRLLRPSGGVAYLPSAETATSTAASEIATSSEATISAESFVLREEPLPGAGEWTHQYGSANNSAFGGETLQNASLTTDMEVQWLGRPGPRHQVDRMVRKPAPIAVNGRLITQGFDRIIALDAFNGTILWSLEVPQLRRYNIPRDASNWCSDGEFVYLAFRGHCWKIQAATGEVIETFDVIGDPSKEWGFDWSYIAREGDTLIGSSTKQGSVYANFWGRSAWYNTDGYAKVCSDNMFGLDPNTGETRWEYSEGVIINTSITIEEGKIYFVESRHPDAKGADHRVMGMGQLFQETFLVALDAQTGNKVWEQKIEIASGDIMFSMAASDGRLVVVSNGGAFNLYAYATADGSEVWRDSIPMATSSHSQHMSRPAIVNGKVYMRPAIYDLQTGERLPESFGCACGTYSCSTNTLIFRAGMWNRDDATMTNWDRWRPDCWLNTVPAQGMVLSPEGGGGCQCAHWLETSFGWIPRTESALVLSKQVDFLDRVDVELGAPLGEGQLHYTLDGSTPTAESPVYEAPFEITASALVTAGVIAPDGTLREVVTRQFTHTEPTTTQDVIRINFQGRGTATPEGWLAETGQVEGLRASGLAYGWANARPSGGNDRKKNEDPLLDSFCSIYPTGTWRIALPTGRYRVTVGVGDAEHPFVTKPFQIEGVTTGEDKQLQGGEFASYTEEVEVTDGVLELGCDNRDGTRVTHIEIERIGE